MLLAGHGVGLVFEHAQGGDEFGPSVAGLNDFVNPAFFGGGVGVGEAVAKLFDFGLAKGVSLVSGFGDFAAIKNVHGAFGAHDGDLGRGIGVIHVGAQMLRSLIYPLPTRVTYTREIDFDREGRIWTSNSNGPAWQIEDGVPRVLRLDPREVGTGGEPQLTAASESRMRRAER